MKSVESLALLYLRTLKSRLMASPADKEERQRIVLEVPPRVASYLLNRKRQELSGLENTYGVYIQVEPKERLGAEEYYLYWAKE